MLDKLFEIATKVMLALCPLFVVSAALVGTFMPIEALEFSSCRAGYCTYSGDYFLANAYKTLIVMVLMLIGICGTLYAWKRTFVRDGDAPTHHPAE